MKDRVPLSLIALVVANLVPLAGALFFGWSAGSILVLYWAENVILGAFTLLKVWTRPWVEGELNLLPRVAISLFFSFHYGLFMLVHGVFAGLIAAQGAGREFDFVPFSVLGWLGDGAGWGLLGFALSHGVSFATHWLGGERHRIRATDLITQPYQRLVVMHVAVLVGGFGVSLLGSPVPALVALVVLKLGLDARAHRREHAPAPEALR